MMYLLQCSQIYLKLTSCLFSATFFFCSTSIISAGIDSLTLNSSSSFLSWTSSLLLYLSMSFLSSLLRLSSSILCSIAFLFYSLAFDSSSLRLLRSSCSSCWMVSKCFSYSFFFRSWRSFFSFLRCFTRSLACLRAFSSSSSFSLRFKLMSSAGSPLMMAISSSIFFSSSRMLFFSISIICKVRLSICLSACLVWGGCIQWLSLISSSVLGMQLDSMTSISNTFSSRLAPASLYW